MSDKIYSTDIQEWAVYINGWANATFPGRSPKASLNKLVMEEIPELLQHLKQWGPEGIGGELADCFILLLDLAVIWGIDLPTAIGSKMIVNERRTWTKDIETGFYNHKGWKSDE
jgi:NTP pyrophosphatase (non-canonical NTP hydrolase)